MPLIRDDDLVRIDLPADGEWVEVKARLSRGDEMAIQRAIVGDIAIVPGGSVGTVNAAAYIEAAEFAVIDVAVRRWSFEEPVTPENVRRLDGESIAALKVALDELYPGPRKEEDRGNSPGSGAATNGASPVPLPISAGSR